MEYYRTKDYHVGEDGGVQMCYAKRFENETLWVDFQRVGVTCDIEQGKEGTDNVKIKVAGLAAVEVREGDWIVYYDFANGGPGIAAYSDAEFNELYEAA